MEKDQVQFYSTLAGALVSISALTFVIWQYGKSKDNQEALVKHHVDKGKMLNTLDGRLRNLELAQCSNPYVRQNTQLTNLLNCPPASSSGPLASAPPAPEIIRPQRPSAEVMQPSRTSTLQMPGGYVGKTNVATSQNLPPMPNYGFFGDGPAGLASGSSSMMMGAFAPGPMGGPAPFEK
jgi:hypothetical protein